MKKIVILFLAAFFALGLTSSLAAQETLDPNSRLYDLIQQWENKGLISKLPAFRPYPRKVLIDILEKVSSQSPAEAALAARYLAELKPRSETLVNIGQNSRLTDDGLYAGDSQTQINTRHEITDLADLAVQFNGYILDHTDGELVPAGRNTSLDYFEDAAGFSVKGRLIKTRMNWSSDVSLGTKEYYLQAGFHRSTFGPLPTNNVVLGGQTPFIPQISYTANLDFLSMSTVMLMLSATDSLGSSRLFPQKYMFMHDIRFYPLPGLELSAFESTIYGGRFDPISLIPTGAYFFNQGFGGNSDNPALGLTGSWRLPADLRLSLAFFADDLSFNDLIKFKITKVKAAGELNLSWTPLTDFLRQISLDYALVTPYTYTHVFNDNGADDPWKTDTGNPTIATGALLPNYYNYTHMGKSLGAALDPNSDRLTLRADLKPLSDLDVMLKGTMIRHGNASEGRTWINADGSIFDDGYNNQIANGGYQFSSSTPFLTQKVIWVTLIGEIGLRYSIPLEKTLDLDFTCNYNLEHLLETSTRQLFQAGIHLVGRF